MALSLAPAQSSLGSIAEPQTVLVVAGNPESARHLISRWSMERLVPGFALFSCGSVRPEGRFDLVVLLEGEPQERDRLLNDLQNCAAPVICLVQEGTPLHPLRTAHPRVMFLQNSAAWRDSLVLLGCESLRRMEWVQRAHRAEVAVQTERTWASLGRYLVQNRREINNALTSVLGNAELMQADERALPREMREQLEAVTTMALRLHEIMARCASLESEMKLIEKSSHPEMCSPSHPATAAPQPR